MRLSQRSSTGSSGRPNHLSRRFAVPHLPLLVVLVLAIAAVFVFVDRSRAAHGRRSAAAERATTIVERNLTGGPGVAAAGATGDHLHG